MVKALKASSIALTIVATLAGCAVGPNYKRPQTQVSPQFAGAEPSTYKTTQDTQVEFWRQFDDDTLDHLVSDALTANHDLRIALGNLVEARGSRRESLYDLAPTVTAAGGYTKQLAPATRIRLPVLIVVLPSRFRCHLGAGLLRTGSAWDRGQDGAGAGCSGESARRAGLGHRGSRSDLLRAPGSADAARSGPAQRRQRDRHVEADASAAGCRQFDGAGYVPGAIPVEHHAVHHCSAAGFNCALHPPPWRADRAGAHCTYQSACPGQGPARAPQNRGDQRPSDSA